MTFYKSPAPVQKSNQKLHKWQVLGGGGGCYRSMWYLTAEHTLLRVLLNISRQILFPGDLHDAAF